VNFNPWVDEMMIDLVDLMVIREEVAVHEESQENGLVLKLLKLQ
jgi:hypothetical protein